MTKLLLSILLIFIVSGCNNIQTTSGKQYLQGYTKPSTNELDQEVYDIANVEPNLKFPARIGLARIDNGYLTNIPMEETEAWSLLAKDMGVNYGEFIPVNRLIAAMVSPNEAKRNPDARLQQVLRTIRLGAARQHLDAVLIYEVYGQGKSYLTPAAITNLTIIGAFITPGRQNEAKGFASSLLIDVKNGYPYGTAETVLSQKQLSTSINSYQNQRDLTERVKTAAAIKLIPEVKEMFHKLMQHQATALKD